MNRKQNALANKLRDRGVPAEWAILIAERTRTEHLGLGANEGVSDFLAGAFVWQSTDERHVFWNGVFHAIAAELGEVCQGYIEYTEEDPDGC